MLWRRLRAVGLALLLLGLAVLRIVAVRHQLSIQATAGDLDRFFEIASMDARPYAGQPVEYPPLTVALLDLVHLFAPGRSAFGAAVIVLNAGFEAALAVILWRAFGGRAALVFLLFDTLLIDFLVVHLDLGVTLAATAAVALWRRQRPAAAGVVLVVAAGIKLWPLALLPFLLAASGAEPRRRLLMATAAGGAALGALWVGLAGGLEGIVEVITFRGAHGWQIESSVGAVIRFVSHAPAQIESGAHRFGTVPTGVGPLLVAAGLTGASVAGVLAARSGRLGIAWVAAAASLMLGSTLLSPQYVVWLLPGVAVAWTERDRLVALPVLVAVVLTWIGSFTYGALLGAQPLFLGLVVVRNLALLAALGLAVRAALRRAPLELRGRLVAWPPARLTERTSVR